MIIKEQAFKNVYNVIFFEKALLSHYNFQDAGITKTICHTIAIVVQVVFFGIIKLVLLPLMLVGGILITPMLMIYRKIKKQEVKDLLTTFFAFFISTLILSAFVMFMPYFFTYKVIFYTVGSLIGSSLVAHATVYAINIKV